MQVFMDNTTWLVWSGDNINLWPDNPPSLLNFLPELNNWIQGIMVVKKRHDQNIWCPTANGNLTLKRAYLHLPGNSRKLHWVNFIWNMGIPDSVSMLI